MLGSDKDMKKVKEYRCGGDFVFTAPKDGEQFYLAPYSYYGDTSTPFIEVYKDGELTRSINCAYVSEVRFDT